MTYQVLARKWRPQTFAALVGQQHVMQALVNALDLQRVHHAYLFTGTRGVGKTTIARLIAKALNCERGVSSQPCGECGACVDIAAGRFVDLLEVDAASRTKVEDTRDLLDNVQYAPTRGRFKVYLIDEVHMLSGHSFNALLKTLEEPPPHVKFLLATTDPQKLPVTVLSRCLQFHLKNLLPAQITQHLVTVLGEEALDFELPALNLIAQAANGSMRDALSLLDQAIALGAGRVTQVTVEQMLGVSSDQVLIDLMQALAEQDLNAIKQVSDQLQVTGADSAYVLARVQTIWHNVALYQFGLTAIDITPLSEVLMQRLATSFGKEDVQLFYEICTLGRRDLPLAPSPQAGFDMVMLRLLAFRPTTRVTEKVPGVPLPIKLKAAAVKSQPEVASVAIAPQEIPPQEPIALAAIPQATELSLPLTVESVAGPVTATPVAITPELAHADPWVALVPQLALTAFSKVLAEHLSFERRHEDHFYLNLAQEHTMMLQERHQRKIQEALTHYFKKPIQLTIHLGRSSGTKSPLEAQKIQHDSKTQQALQAYATDGPLQTVLQTFDAKLLPETLTFD